MPGKLALDDPDRLAGVLTDQIAHLTLTAPAHDIDQVDIGPTPPALGQVGGIVAVTHIRLDGPQHHMARTAFQLDYSLVGKAAGGRGHGLHLITAHGGGAVSNNIVRSLHVQSQNGRSRAGQDRGISSQLSVSVTAQTIDFLLSGVVDGEDQAIARCIGVVDIRAASSKGHCPLEELTKISGAALHITFAPLDLCRGHNVALFSNIIGGFTDTQLAHLVAAPCYHGAVGAKCHNMTICSGNIYNMSQIVIGIALSMGTGSSAVDHPDRNVPGGGSKSPVIAVAQFQSIVVTPSIDITILIQRQGIVIARSDGHNVVEIGLLCISGILRTQQHLHGGSTGFIFAAAQLTGAAKTPGINIAVPAQCQGMIPAHSNGHDILQIGVLKRADATLGQGTITIHVAGINGFSANITAEAVTLLSSQRLHLIGTVGIGAIAQLVATVKAPGPDSTVGSQQDRVGIACIYHRHGFSGFVVILHQQAHQIGVSVLLSILGVVKVEADVSGAKAVGLLSLKGVLVTIIAHGHQTGIENFHLNVAASEQSALILAGAKIKADILLPVEVTGINSYATVTITDGCIAQGGSVRPVIGSGSIGIVDDYILLPNTGANREFAIGIGPVTQGAVVIVTRTIHIALSAQHHRVVITDGHCEGRLGIILKGGIQCAAGITEDSDCRRALIRADSAIH